MTVDGKIDSVARQGAWISSPVDGQRVDRLRAAVDAVLVGGRTLLEGDPRLTVKSPALRAERVAAGLPENPAKVGVVSEAALLPNCRFLEFGPARRLIYTTQRSTPAQLAVLHTAGAEVFVLGETRVDLPGMLASLYTQGISSLLVEGGATLIAELFRLQLIDELAVYIAPRIFGGDGAPTLAGGPGFLPQDAPQLQLLSLEKLDAGGGVLLRYQTIQR
jgi:2,5-diamino-6-(ribosylamino)-4(3H)-pyrimidinone 5'-phosphate reductase